jgi:hypothetical protein
MRGDGMGWPFDGMGGSDLGPQSMGSAVPANTNTAAVAAGKLSAAKGIATEFGAAILAEFLFFLLDKLLGGRLSGSAKKLDASPQAMQGYAAQQQVTAAGVTKQSSMVADLARSMLGGAVTSMAAASFFSEILRHAEASKKASGVQQQAAKTTTEISSTIGQAQGTFMTLVKKFGSKVMVLLNSMFGAFMAIVVATLALKIILALVMRLISRVTGKGDRAAAQATTTLGGITAAMSSRGPASALPGGTPPAMTGIGSGRTSGSIGGPTTGQNMMPNVLTAGPGVPGWVPTRTGMVAVTLQDGKVKSVDVPTGPDQPRSYRVSAVSDADGDGRKETQEMLVNLDASQPPG